jgi:hypothetical protein
MKCKICGNSEDNKVYKIIEMLFLIRDEFEYFQCSQCDCLQISDFPTNMEKYYPDNYYSFGNILKTPFSLRFCSNTIFRRLINDYAILRKGVIDKLFYKTFAIYNTYYLDK